MGAEAQPRPDPATLRLIHQDLVSERDRLRDARREVTRQLGPLPASAGLVLGLFGAFASKGSNEPLLLAALGAFLAVVALSARRAVGVPYRRLRAAAEAKEEVRFTEDDRRAAIAQELERASDLLPEPEWLVRAIRIERRIYGDSGAEPEEDSLQSGFDREWRGLRWVQGAFAAEVVLLVLASVVD